MNNSGSILITTNRLLLREFNPEINKKTIADFNDEEFMEYFGLNSNEELQLEKERFKHGLTMFGRSFCYFHLISKQSGKVIGWCGFHTIYTRHDRAELGYVLNDDLHKGKGYMKEALRPILQFGFEKLNLHRIEAFIDSENTPSFKLLNSNGFVREGLMREHYFTNGKHEDSLVFSLLKKDFLNSRPTSLNNL